MYLFGSCCLFHDCLTGCLAVLTVVSVCDRVEICLMSSTTRSPYACPIVLYCTVQYSTLVGWLVSIEKPTDRPAARPRARGKASLPIEL